MPAVGFQPTAAGGGQRPPIRQPLEAAVSTYCGRARQVAEGCWLL